MTYSILGIDSSHWNGKLNTDKLKDNNIKFAFVKAGEVNLDGSLFNDDQCDRSIRELKRVNIPCGLYYYFHPSKGSSKQARHFAEIYNKNKPDLPPVIDVEDTDKYLPKDVCSNLFSFIHGIEDNLGQTPIIYSTNSFIVSKIGNPNWNPETKFWIARYNTSIKDLSIKIKDNVIIWQFTDKLLIPGIKPIDGNYWIKSDDEFNKFINKSSVNEPIEITRMKRLKEA